MDKEQRRTAKAQLVAGMQEGQSRQIAAAKIRFRLTPDGNARMMIEDQSRRDYERRRL